MIKEKLLNTALIMFYTACLVIVAYIVFKPDENHAAGTKKEVVKKEIKPQLNQFGFIDDSLQVITDKIKRNETLSGIMSKFNLSNDEIASIVGSAKKVFDIRKIGLGKPYHAFTSKDNSLKYLVYETDPINHIIFKLDDTLAVYESSKEVTVDTKTLTGVINSSLYQSLMENDASPELAEKLAQVFAWQVDFYRIQKGDNFKVIYEEESVDGKPVGIRKITGAYFNHKSEDFYAIRFDKEKKGAYYDENGKSLRKAFLKAPLEFTRISSRYTKRRFHPVQKRYKPHLGTDYAAPTGTPIRTVGDGVVLAASYNRGNGNYVKIKHNGTYTTQYLHMSKIAKGMRPGRHVSQGEVIGYVGSTGLATGPHLCYRFWKNGVQVDPFSEKVPNTTPLAAEYIEEFMVKKDRIIDQLNQIDAAVEPVYASAPAEESSSKF